jgi:hypothetical protein
MYVGVPDQAFRPSVKTCFVGQALWPAVALAIPKINHFSDAGLRPARQSREQFEGCTVSIESAFRF